jgi:hypothetical protein
VDHPEASKEALDNEGLSYIETEVAQVRLPHRPASWHGWHRDSAKSTFTSTTPIAG